MNLADLSIRRPIFISCVVILMMVVGLLAMSRLPVDQFPNVTFPVILVNTPYPGAGPKEVETLVSRPLEDELSTLPGLKTLRSINTEGRSRVIAEFTLETDIKYAEQQIRDRVSSARRKLPEDIEEPSIRRRDPSDQPILTIALTAELPQAKMYDVADEMVRPKIEQVSQVGLVEVLGGRKREIRVELDRAKLREREMSATRIADRIRASGQDVPAGKLDNGQNETIYRTLGEFRSIKDIGNVVANFLGNDVSTRVDQVGTVVDGLEDQKSQSYVNGKPALTLLVFRQTGANTIAVVDSVKKRVEEMNKELQSLEGKPSLSVVQDGSFAIRANVFDVKESIVIGIILTVIVVFFFLRSARSTLITALALPNSLIGAFILMAIAGFTINIMTLLALSLAVGLLIDDAIVVRENIFRHMEMGKDPETAAREGTKEVTLAVVATSFTVIAVFGPIGFLQGVVGQFFREFGITVCFAMLISLFDALTMAPMLSAYFAGDGHHAATGKTGWLQRTLDKFDRAQTWLENQYESVLKVTLRRRLTALAMAGVVFGISVVLVKWVPKTFLPPSDTGEFNLTLELPPGSSLTAMGKVATEVDAIVRKNPEVLNTVLTVGSQEEANTAQIFVGLVQAKKRKINTSDFKDALRKQLKPYAYAKPIFREAGGAGGGQRPFQLNILGSDLASIEQVSKQIFERLKDNPNLKDVSWGHKTGKPELQVALDARSAERVGISTLQVGQELRTQIEGVVPAVYREDGREYDIRVRVKDDQRDLKTAFPELMIPNINGSLVKLTQVAKPVETVGPASINRQDRGRFIQISADIAPGGSGMGQAISDATKILESEVKLPPGTRHAFVGQAESFKELMFNMLIAMGLGILFIYLVLASLYESFITPLTIMLVLPLAACGAFIALFVMQASLDIFSMIGCIMLLGIATKNSILLVDYTKQLTAEGMAENEAIIVAGKTRLRPILMTTIALIAGMLPVAIGLNEASKQRTSMGIAIIGGLISSTLLTLIVVPAAYSYIERFRVWLSRLGRRILGGTRPAAKPTIGTAMILLIAFGMGRSASARSYLNEPDLRSTPLTIGSAVSSALESHPAVLSAQARADEAAARKSEAFSRILPRIDGRLSALERHDAFNSNSLIFGGEPYNLYEVGLQATQPIFSGGAFWGNFQAARKAIDLRALDLEIAQQDVARQVIQAFYAILLEKSRLEAMMKMEKLQEELLATASRRLRLGFGKDLEVLQARARLAMTRPEITKSEIQLRINAAQLARLLNRSTESRLEVAGSLEPIPFSRVQQAMKDRAIRRPEVERAELEARQFEDFRKVELADHWPSLNLVGSISRNATKKADLLDGDRTSWAFGLQLAIPIFSGLSSFHERAALSARQNQLELGARQVRDNLAVEQVQTSEELEASEALLKASRTALDESQKALASARRLFGTGTATFQQVSEVQRDAIQAELAFQSAQFDHINKLARYFVAAGWPLKELVNFLDNEGKTKESSS